MNDNMKTKEAYGKRMQSKLRGEFGKTEEKSNAKLGKSGRWE